MAGDTSWFVDGRLLPVFPRSRKDKRGPGVPFIRAIKSWHPTHTPRSLPEAHPPLRLGFQCVYGLGGVTLSVYGFRQEAKGQEREQRVGKETRGTEGRRKRFSRRTFMGAQEKPSKQKYHFTD